MNNIKRARLNKGITGEQLGKLVGVQKSAISKYERNAIQPSKDIILAMADALSCSTDYLLGRTNDQTVLEKDKSPVEYDEALELAQRISNLSELNQTKVLDYLDLLENLRNK
jgi:transcriptional regulator with XRE-family HTH domain